VVQATIGIALIGLAFVTAPVAALVSRICWRADWLTVPYGLVIAIAGSMAVVLLAAGVSKGYGILAAGGWIIGLGVVVTGTSQGSFLIAADALGWSFLILGTAATLSTAMWGGRWL